MGSHALKHEPLDAYNLALTEILHPAGWVNPEPADRYNMVVIGAGTAGLVTAAGAAILGAKVALVERDLMGGDCLNFGCVPSKALIRSARAAAAVRDAGRFGVEVPPGVSVNFPAVMERMRKLRTELSPTDSANRFRGLGVDVFIGDGRFVAPDCVEVAGKRLKFKKAAITTGARAASLPIPGLVEAGYLTNETVFSLTELPRRVAVIGAGPIGCELAQTFARFGAQVTLLEMAPQILIREDRDAAERVERAIIRDGVEIVTRCKISGVARRGNEKILAIEYEKQNGVKVDDYLRTTNPLVYAGGDVASPYKFTHLSDAQARIIIRNALFFGRQRASELTIPWCTYTDPEIAHVGLYEAEAKERGIAVATYTQELKEVDRAVLDGETEGFVRVHVREGTDRIVGATIVASHAGEIISELTTAIKAGMGLGALGDVIHPYPTQADAIRRAAGLYTRTRLTPFVAGLMKGWFALTR
jgi:pyruvate/2-oxoglutarate dehydrogenase complex dihydrolipoamide dehydrogenase (E3) component